ncbi:MULTISPECIES: hypothetical protein [unclassified Nitratiruptor]|uniref:hypothetical protein n=1 Tax=unclassified Nitratiruptor TaxID=2624044 RepID=UPI001916C882|nr:MULTISPECIES: hypothetical protein [unclassified Nitratiruptor]
MKDKILKIRIARIATKTLSANNFIMSRLAFFIIWYLFISAILWGIFFCCGVRVCFLKSLLWFLVVVFLLLLVHSLATIASMYRTQAKLLKKGIHYLEQQLSQSNECGGDRKD